MKEIAYIEWKTENYYQQELTQLMYESLKYNTTLTELVVPCKLAYTRKQ